MSGMTVFTDLDDTLFQTEGKALERASAAPVAGMPALSPAAQGRDGAVLSYHAPDQLVLLQLLRDCTLIPVTGRNRGALDRVTSPMFRDYRITSHGAIIYGPDDRVLPDWQERVCSAAARFGTELHAIADRIQTRVGALELPLRSRVIEDAGLPVYVSLKGEGLDHGLADRLLREAGGAASPEGPWTIHHNGHNAAFLPPYASKADAVAFVMGLKRVEDPAAVFLGIGDSLSDIAFLKQCDFALVPRATQIQEACWQ